MTRKRWLYKLCFLLTVLYLLTLLMGCADTTPRTTQTSATETTSGTTVDLNSRPNSASGVLRLWRYRVQTLNPLLEKSESGQAANDLIFEGLFKINGRQQIEPALATNLTVIEGTAGLAVQIQLAESRAFHNGVPVTAQDIKACFDYIMTHPAQSPFAAKIPAVIAVQVIDAHTLQLTLNQASPWLAYALTFPIVPAASLYAGAYDLIPGTGRFKMESYSTTAGMTLVRSGDVADISSLKTIHISEFSSLTDAMKAYESDQLDLINLPPDDYSRYILRNSLHFEQYTANQIVFLAYNTKQSPELADPGRLLFIKQLLAADQFSAAGGEDWGENTPVPLNADCWLISDTADQRAAAVDSLGPGEWGGYQGEINVLVPASERLLVEAADLVGQMLKTAGIRFKITSLAADAYVNALASGKYDLALLQSVMPVEPDVTWLYSDNRPAAFALLNGLTGPGLADYEIWRQNLAQAIWQMPNGQDGALGDTLYETAVRSPWSVLLIRSAAILYGDRIVGQCRPDINHPYEGIEELWIWSGQSS